jgi:Uma2 family endonuclease
MAVATQKRISLEEYLTYDDDPDRAWVRVGTLVDGAYQFDDFTGQQPIVSPTFLSLTLTANQVLTAGE